MGKGKWAKPGGSLALYKYLYIHINWQIQSHFNVAQNVSGEIPRILFWVVGRER
jgi:hypothetical protein